MISGVPLETCRAFKKLWNNKFYYKAASFWLFLLIHVPTIRGIIHVGNYSKNIEKQKYNLPTEGQEHFSFPARTHKT